VPEPIIRSMLDQDFYKFNMMQAIFHRFPDVNVEYEFKLRNYAGGEFEHLQVPVEKEIRRLCELRFQKDELDYLRKFPWLSENFIEYLHLFQLNDDYIKVWYDEDGSSPTGYYGNFRVSIRGSWLNTILFEVPVLAIINELFSKAISTSRPFEGETRLKEKIRFIRKVDAKGFQIADFGTRRRLSAEWQAVVIDEMVKAVPSNFIGTSNVYWARHFGIKPIGTQAHEWFMAMQALTRVADSQKFALEQWAQEYRGRLGIALSDTIGIDAFLRDFDLYFAKLFDGVRLDSGNLWDGAEKVIEHYRKLGVDPETKTIVFSNKLNFEEAFKLFVMHRGRIKTSFGIGTFITNDVGIEAPQGVIKLTRVNGRPVAKISDSKGKGMCPDEGYVRYLKQQFGVSQ